MKIENKQDCQTDRNRKRKRGRAVKHTKTIKKYIFRQNVGSRCANRRMRSYWKGKGKNYWDSERI